MSSAILLHHIYSTLRCGWFTRAQLSMVLQSSNLSSSPDAIMHTLDLAAHGPTLLVLYACRLQTRPIPVVH